MAGTPVCPRRTRAGRKRSAWAVSQKNALVHLNELRPGLRYEVTARSGPLHAPVFAVGVDVNGFHFEGRGATVKRAKLRAAERALRSFVQFPNASQALATVGPRSSFSPFSGAAEGAQAPCRLPPGRRQGGGGPVVLLNRLRPGLRYTWVLDAAPGGSPRSFVVAVRVEGRVFEGCGSSKRAAKSRAAAAALWGLAGPRARLLGLHGNGAQNQLPQVCVCVCECEQGWWAECDAPQQVPSS